MVQATGVPPGGSGDFRIFIPRPTAKHLVLPRYRPDRIPVHLTPVIFRIEPIRHPFTDIPGQLVYPIRTHAVLVPIHIRQRGVLRSTLGPRMGDVALDPSGRFIPPGEYAPILTARGLLPFRLRRQTGTTPST